MARRSRVMRPPRSEGQPHPNSHASITQLLQLTTGISHLQLPAYLLGLPVNQNLPLTPTPVSPRPAAKARRISSSM